MAFPSNTRVLPFLINPFVSHNFRLAQPSTINKHSRNLEVFKRTLIDQKGIDKADEFVHILPILNQCICIRIIFLLVCIEFQFILETVAPY